MKSYWVYILSSQKNGALYIGITNDLIRCVYEHKKGMVKGFTWKYAINQLVYAEEFEDSIGAVAREKYLKKWNRVRKLTLIEEHNPEWEDLYDTII